MINDDENSKKPSATNKKGKLFQGNFGHPQASRAWGRREVQIFIFRNILFRYLCFFEIFKGQLTCGGGGLFFFGSQISLKKMGSRSIPSAVDCRVNFSSFFFLRRANLWLDHEKRWEVKWMYWLSSGLGGLGGGLVCETCVHWFFGWNTLIISVSLNHRFCFLGEANKIST